MDQGTQRGFTLIEFLAVMAILTILMTVGVPALDTILQKSRLRGAAEDLASTLHLARSEAIAHPGNGRVYVSFDQNVSDTTDWCFGIRSGSDCDCRVSDPTDGTACSLDVGGTPVLKVVSSQEFPGVSLQDLNFTSDYTDFNPIRGTAKNGHITLRGERDITIIVSALGRVSLCSPAGTRYLHGYRECD